MGLRRKPVGGDLRYYVLSDHLGGAWATVDHLGNGARYSLYYAYGQSRLSTGGLPTDRLYTGQTFDDAVGLYHYGARSYDPYLGRFVSPDSLVPDPSNPQALNRYSYTLNNPLKYTDPDGHWVHIAVGAALGGAIAYGVQVVGNVHDNGLSVEAFTNVDVRTVAAGAVAGGVGAATFGLATAAVGAVGVKGAGAAVAANVASGRVAGVASDLVMGEDALAGLTDVSGAAIDATLPLAGRAARGSLGQTAKMAVDGPLVSVAARSQKHHTVPREILDMYLPPDVAQAVRGMKGSPNVWSIPEDLHRGIHSGPGGGKYNARFKEELRKLREITADAVLRIRDDLAQEFGFEVFRPGGG